MNILLVGSGGREHALAWKIAQSPLLKRLVADNDAAYALIRNEIDMHTRFKHACMVEFFASESTNHRGSEREVFILMEYCPNGHLFDNMRKMGDRRYGEKELLRLFKTLCECVCFLHGFLHVFWCSSLRFYPRSS